MKNLIILLSICIISCTSVHDIQEEPRISISFASTLSNVQDTLFDVKYIKLETTDTCLLGTIGQIETFSDSLLLVLDINNSYLYAFNQKGKYLTHIGKKGEGPGEYIKLSSFFIDKQRNRIGLLDIGKQKVIFYQITDFSFQSEMDFPFETSCCTVSEEGYMLWNSTGYGSDRTGNAYFILTDSTGTILQTAVEKQFKSGYSLGDPRNVYTFQGKNYAYSPFNLSVWKIENDSIQKDVQFSLGNPSPPYSFLMEKSHGGQSCYFKALEESDYISYYTIREFTQYYSILYIVHNQRFIGFYNKHNQLSYLYQLKQFQDMLKVGKMDYLSSGFFHEYCVSPLNVSDLLELKRQGYSFQKELEDLLHDASNEDNQILMCIRLK